MQQVFYSKREDDDKFRSKCILISRKVKVMRTENIDGEIK